MNGKKLAAPMGASSAMKAQMAGMGAAKGLKAAISAKMFGKKLPSPK